MGAQCPTNYNPADFYVQVLAIVPGREVESRERIGKICDSFATSKVARDMEQLLAAKSQTQALEQPENGYTYKATWFMQFRAVLWRSWLSVLKEPLLVKVRLIQTTVSAAHGLSVPPEIPHRFFFRFADGCRAHWTHLSRATTDAGGRHEHQWRHLSVPDQHDLPERVRHHQCKSNGLGLALILPLTCFSPYPALGLHLGAACVHAGGA